MRTKVNNWMAKNRISAVVAICLAFLIAGAITPKLRAQDLKNGSNISALISDAKAAQGRQRATRLATLQMSRPLTESDVRALALAAHEKQTDIQDAATKALRNVSSDASNLGSAYVALLEDSSNKVQIAAINGCANLKVQEAAPKILTLLSKQPHAKFAGVRVPWMMMDHMQYVDEAAQALADLDYEPALDEILSRDELMTNSSFGGPLVAKYGARALPKIIEMIRKNDKRKNGGIQAIVYMRDDAALPILIGLLDDSDQEVAGAAAHSLSEMPAKGAAVGSITDALKRKLQNPNQFIRGYAYVGLLRLDPKGNLPLAMEALRKDRLVSLDILYALIRNPVTEAVPYLKEYIAIDEKKQPNDSNVRAVAAQAIYKITGEKVPYKGVESEIKRYEQGLIPDPYDPYGKDGAHFKK